MNIIPNHNTDLYLADVFDDRLSLEPIIAWHIQHPQLPDELNKACAGGACDWARPSTGFWTTETTDFINTAITASSMDSFQILFDNKTKEWIGPSESGRGAADLKLYIKELKRGEKERLEYIARLNKKEAGEKINE